MNKEAQRITIAEACGIQVHFPYDPTYASDEQWTYRPTNAPNYPEDLNAMREAVKMLPFSRRKRYRQELQKIRSRILSSGGMVAIEECIDSSAEDRAEAFLRALDLWVD